MLALRKLPTSPSLQKRCRKQLLVDVLVGAEKEKQANPEFGQQIPEHIKHVNNMLVKILKYILID